MEEEGLKDEEEKGKEELLYNYRRS